MRLILTRHGETIENKQGISQGHMPGRLNKEGILQAEKLALRLKDENIDAVYSSDLARSVDTTKIIVKYHPNVPVHYVEELREGGLGGWTGKKLDNVDWDNRPSDVETRDSMRKRSKKIIDDAYEKYPNGTVLFVAHAGLNKAMITVILNKPEQDMMNIKQSNASVNIFEIREDKKHKVILMNCVKHLEK